jgi:hypothetical protein
MLSAPHGKRDIEKRIKVSLTIPGYTGNFTPSSPLPRPVAKTTCLTSLNTRSPSGRLMATVHLEPEASGLALMTVEDVQTLRSKEEA